MANKHWKLLINPCRSDSSHYCYAPNPTGCRFQTQPSLILTCVQHCLMADSDEEHGCPQHMTGIVRREFKTNIHLKVT